MMTDDGFLQIDDTVRVPRRELTFKATRSSGPGGQHVNTSSTRIELWWSPTDSQGLTDRQRRRVLDQLASRLDTENRLRLVSDRFRSQRRNREEVTERFRALVAEALTETPPRKPTKKPRSADETRLDDKKRRGRLKRQRRPPEGED